MIKVTYRDGCGDGSEVMEYEPYRSPMPMCGTKPECEVLVEFHSFGCTQISEFIANPKAKSIPWVRTMEKRNDTKREYKNCGKRYAACDFWYWYSDMMEIRMAVLLARGKT